MNSRTLESARLSGSAPASLHVRLKRLAANYREAVERAGGAAVAPVVKANAYSLGMAPVARALMGSGADNFFVARLDEGIALRIVAPNARIFVLDGIAPDTAPAFVVHRLIPVLNSLDELRQWSARAKQSKQRLEAALQIDTGMNRSGIPSWEVAEIAAEARSLLAEVDPVLIMSHLACADEPGHALNRTQLERFRICLARLPPAPASLAASAGIELGKDYVFDLVRPGLALYGGNPVPANANPYANVVTLTGRVLQLRRVEPGDTVGYSCGFTAKRPTRLAIAAIGYADGLIRSGGQSGAAAIGGVRVPFAGRISMDLVALDVTDVPPENLESGAEIEFLGETITLEEVAKAAGTITHEVLTSLAPRAARFYLEE